jgi:rhodanese-related sulfurtransferase
VVVGGGFIGLEMAENLVHRGIDVTIVELLDQVMPPLDKEMALPVQERLSQHGINLRLGEKVAGFAQNADGLQVETDQGVIDTDLVILAIGVRPESDLAAAAGLELNQRGAIVVDEHMRTTDPSIYAVGDAIEVRNAIIDVAAMLPLAGPANRQGRTAAENIAGKNTRFRGVQGTSVLGAFGLTVASTGLSEKALQAAGISDYEKVRLHAGNHVGYYPGATTIALKLVFRPSDGRVLGAQAVGEQGVDKRIDVIAMAIQLGATVEDLAETELCYAPAFGAAKDPVNMAGMIASNVRNGDLKISHWENISASDYVLDVRPPAQYQECHTAGAANIPLTELRDRLSELPAGKPVHVTCNVGQTAYFATRMLVQHGVDARCITGGERSHISIAKSDRSPVSATCLS